MDTHELRRAAGVAQEKRRREHPWTERVEAWIRERDEKEEVRENFYSGREIWIGAMQGMDSRYGRREALDAAQAMRDLGWTPGFRTSERERTTRGYWRPGTGEAEKKVAGVAQMRQEKGTEGLDIFGDWK